jgi:hypothetical protein
MTRWLEAARRASEAGKKPNLPKKPSQSEVNSVKSVFSCGRSTSPARSSVVPEEQTSGLFAAHVAALAETDGVARSPEAIEAVWDWALALARENSRQKATDIPE